MATLGDVSVVVVAFAVASKSTGLVPSFEGMMCAIGKLRQYAGFVKQKNELNRQWSMKCIYTA